MARENARAKALAYPEATMDGRATLNGRAHWGLRTAQATVLFAATVGMLGAGPSPYERLGHEMMCVCGCGQVLLECNHVGCPDSARMIGELKEQIAAGGGDKPVLNWFAAKYGAVALAAPMRGGFDDVAWIMPIAVFLMGTLGTAGLVWTWRKRLPQLAGSPAASFAGAAPDGTSAEDVAMRERIRRETEWQGTEAP